MMSSKRQPTKQISMDADNMKPIVPTSNPCNNEYISTYENSSCRNEEKSVCPVIDNIYKSKETSLSDSGVSSPVAHVSVHYRTKSLDASGKNPEDDESLRFVAPLESFEVEENTPIAKITPTRNARLESAYCQNAPKFVPPPASPAATSTTVSSSESPFSNVSPVRRRRVSLADFGRNERETLNGNNDRAPRHSRRISDTDIIMPSLATPKRKNGRRTSLTNAETGLLDALRRSGTNFSKRQTISSSRNDAKNLTDELPPMMVRSNSVSNLELAKARSELQKSIDERREGILTMAELSFLERLASSPGASIKELENAATALHKCPLYNIPEEHCNQSLWDSDSDDDSFEEEGGALNSVMAFLSNSHHKRNGKREESGMSNVMDFLSNSLHGVFPEKKLKGKDDSAMSNVMDFLSTSLHGTYDTAFRNEVWIELQYASEIVEDTTDTKALTTTGSNLDLVPSPPGFSYFICYLFDSQRCLDSANCNDDAIEDLYDDDSQEGDGNGECSFDERNFNILGTSVEDIYSQPHVLSPPIMNALRRNMPYLVQEDNFWLKYSMIRDGASIRTLLSHVRSSVRTVLAIETTRGEVFGSFTASPWRANGSHYYGSGESFLWRMTRSRLSNCANVQEQAALERDIEVFPWTSSNRCIQLANPNRLIVGGGGPEDGGGATSTMEWGFGLALNSDLLSGSSSPCYTFGSPKLTTLSPDGIFEISNLEVWTMSPVDTLDQAEQLELARAFIVEHAAFVES